MKKKDAYIWYSGATDVTGQNLAKELGIDSGRNKPKNKRIVIGWGAKTDKDIVGTGLANTIVLNHPNYIKNNRNKLTTLSCLKKEGITVADFAKAEDIMHVLATANHIFLPLVGRTKYHQGGKGFWLCLTKAHVENAIKEGAQYFQNYIDIKDEYRLHIFDGKPIYAVKKVKRNNMEEAFINQHAEKIQNVANKNDKKLDKDTMSYVLGRLAKENKNADMIVRSNNKGWKFSHIKGVDKDMESLAIKALKAVNLDFGAVDCCMDANSKPWIIEINSGPGLQGSTLKTWVEVFSAKLKDIMNPTEKAKVKVKEETLVDRNTKKESKSKLQGGSAKERLGGIRELLDLVADADESEAAAVESLLRKRLGV